MADLPRLDGEQNTDNMTPEQMAAQARQTADAVAEQERLRKEANERAAADRAAKAAQDQKQQAAMAAAAAERKINNHFNYGGQEGQAAADARNFHLLAGDAQNRQGEQINYGLANNERQNAYWDRSAQGNAANLMWDRATGKTPSIAGMRADQDMRTLAAAQTSAAASARGPAALALAQQGSAANTAAGQSTISNSAQINSAQERQQAEQAAFGAFSGMRGQDYQGMGLEADMAQKQAAINAAQRAQNDQFSLGLYGNELDVNKAQLGAQGNQVAIATGQAQSQAALAQAAQQHSDDRTDKYIGYGLGAAGTAAGIGAMMLMGGGGSPGNVNPAQTGTAGQDFGSSPDSPYGAPGSTPGGVDWNGAPVAGTGGGYDPDPNHSDVNAKQNIRPIQAAAWDEGHKAALADLQRLAGKNGAELKAYGEHPLAREVRNMRANAWDEGHMAPQSGLMEASSDPQRDRTEAWIEAINAQKAGLLAQGPAVQSRDPVTDQFAKGLAPSAYDYKPGLGTSGQKVGPMAQNMAANPITDTAVRQNPHTGLLSIDSADGLKVALGGVGHLAQKQRETDAEIAKLRAMAAQMQGSTRAQSDGLMAQGSAVRNIPNYDGYERAEPIPSVGEQYLNFVRGQ